MMMMPFWVGRGVDPESSGDGDDEDNNHDDALPGRPESRSQDRGGVPKLPPRPPPQVFVKYRPGGR
jgi:hypothetical protein